MKNFRSLLFFLSAVLSVNAQADEGMSHYSVTVTNLTKSQIFTPVMLASHRASLSFFTLGEAASAELEILAESGNPGPLAQSLLDSGKALATSAHNNVLLPGTSVTLHITANKRNNHLSLAAMLVPTNDAFIALNGVRLPRSDKALTTYARVYDAGTETNDELCVSIPGPPFICQGEAISDAGGEGYVYVHNGIHGIGDLNAAEFDWNNPAAKVVIQKLD